MRSDLFERRRQLMEAWSDYFVNRVELHDFSCSRSKGDTRYRGSSSRVTGMHSAHGKPDSKRDPYRCVAMLRQFAGLHQGGRKDRMAQVASPFMLDDRDEPSEYEPIAVPRNEPRLVGGSCLFRCQRAYYLGIIGRDPLKGRRLSAGLGEKYTCCGWPAGKTDERPNLV